jgi:hypothetical protein
MRRLPKLRKRSFESVVPTSRHQSKVGWKFHNSSILCCGNSALSIRRLGRAQEFPHDASHVQMLSIHRVIQPPSQESVSFPSTIDRPLQFRDTGPACRFSLGSRLIKRKVMLIAFQLGQSKLVYQPVG